jgi:hypothetical protein
MWIPSTGVANQCQHQQCSCRRNAFHLFFEIRFLLIGVGFCQDKARQDKTTGNAHGDNRWAYCIHAIAAGR